MKFLDYLFGYFYFSVNRNEGGYNDPENSALALLLIFLVFNCISITLLLVLFTNISDFISLQKERDILIICITYALGAYLSRQYFIVNERYKYIANTYDKNDSFMKALIYSYLILSVCLLIISGFLMIPK